MTMVFGQTSIILFGLVVRLCRLMYSDVEMLSAVGAVAFKGGLLTKTRWLVANLGFVGTIASKILLYRACSSRDCMSTCVCSASILRCNDSFTALGLASKHMSLVAAHGLLTIVAPVGDESAPG